MNMKKQKEKKAGKIPFPLKVTGILLLTFLLLFFAAVLFVHSFLGKIDYQPGTATVAVETDSADTTLSTEILEEDQESSGTSLADSTAEEIPALEQRLLEQTSGMEDVLFDENVMNILLIGYDSRDADSRGRSDTNILVSINQETKEITMTSIMRDCYVSIPGYGNNRINAAYAFGGGSLLIETIEKNFQISVNNYVAVNFYAFMDIIDLIGGIEIEVSDAEAEVMNRYIRELNRLEGSEETKD